MVCVLMSTFNGQKYIEEQLKSIINQKNVQVKLLVRDDGSNDNTIKILNEWKKKGFLSWYTGENLKPARSFMDLIEKSPKAEYYAFSDQDDFWLDDKLSTAINALKQYENTPALYYSQTQLVDSNLNYITTKSINPILSLSQALINHTATGCTIVFNNKLKNILLQYKPQYISMHDSWCQLVCLAVDGKIYFDKQSHILYRQHESNVLGLQVSWKKEWITRIKKNFISKERERSKTVHELITGYNDYISTENLQLLFSIENYNKNIYKKLKLLFSCKFKPLSTKHNIFFRISVLLNRF